MKHQTKWLATAIAVAGGLVIGGSTLAQDYATGTPTLSNIPTTMTALYANWASSPPTTISSSPAGLEIYSYGYGSGYYANPTPVPILNVNDAEAVLTVTVNNVVNPSANVWIGIPFAIGENSGNVFYGGYVGEYAPGYVDTQQGGMTASWNGNTVTEVAPLTAGQIAAIQTGSDVIYSINLELDPAVYPGGFYDVTFDSLVLQPVPEPATLALLGLGAVGFLTIRRRK